MKLKNLQKYYVIKDYERELTQEQLDEKQFEINYIEREVIAKKDIMREKKTDEELLDDVRYLGKYADYLLQRISNRTKYVRLGLPEPKKNGIISC